MHDAWWSFLFTGSNSKLFVVLAAADALYDLGAGLEIVSPLCPHLFLEMAGLGNFAKVNFFFIIQTTLQFLCLDGSNPV